MTILDAWQAQLQRELGTELRRFSSPAAALAWFVVQRGRRMGKSLDLAGAGGAASPEGIAQTQRTYAAIATCLDAHHPADDPEEPLAHARDPRAAKVEAERRVAELARWVVISEGGASERFASDVRHRRFADELGMSLHACERYFRAITRVLRRRFEKAGLLEERA